MKEVVFTSKFKKDFKKQSHHTEAALKDVIQTLRAGKKLPPKYRDHKLLGDKNRYRECHLFPDTLLIYYVDADVIKLIRIGSHSDLF